LPEVGRAIGKSLNEFKKATAGLSESISTPVVKAETKIEPKPEEATVKAETVSDKKTEVK